MSPDQTAGVDGSMSDWRLTNQGPVGDPDRWRRLPKGRSKARHAPQDYKASAELLDAIDTAICVGQPLVLTGEPGVGKTDFAEHVAYRLGLPALDPKKPSKRVLRFDIKSTTQGRDLLYRYDALDHFNAANIRKEEVHARDFITFEALGEGILRTLDPHRVEGLTGSRLPHHEEPVRSVVLIDEIDKAPRDVPNDLLREISDMVFKVPELGRSIEVAGNHEHRPIVIFTSNRETRLPDAFMRRCCFYHIPFPPEDLLREIVVARIADLPWDCNLVSDAIRLIQAIRKSLEGRGGRPPGVAELLAFLDDLKDRRYGPQDRLRPDREDWKRSAAVNFLEGDAADSGRIDQVAQALSGHAATT